VFFFYAVKGWGFELGENLLASLPVGLKCPVDILSGGSREANPFLAGDGKPLAKLSFVIPLIKGQKPRQPLAV
jgi:hypothetical protein